MKTTVTSKKLSNQYTYKVESNNSITYSTIIEDLCLEFHCEIIDEYALELSYKVDDCYMRQNKAKIRITKWIIAVFKEVKTLGYSELYAASCDVDGEKEYRDKGYKKVGFYYPEDCETLILFV